MLTPAPETPGVSVNALHAFASPVVPVATAVPAFTGHTPQASYQGKSYLNVPANIISFADFQAYFCYPNRYQAADPAKQYSIRCIFGRLRAGNNHDCQRYFEQIDAQVTLRAAFQYPAEFIVLNFQQQMSTSS